MSRCGGAIMIVAQRHAQRPATDSGKAGTGVASQVPPLIRQRCTVIPRRRRRRGQFGGDGAVEDGSLVADPHDGSVAHFGGGPLGAGFQRNHRQALPSASQPGARHLDGTAETHLLGASEQPVAFADEPGVRDSSRARRRSPRNRSGRRTRESKSSRRAVRTPAGPTWRTAPNAFDALAVGRLGARQGTPPRNRSGALVFLPAGPSRDGPCVAHRAYWRAAASIAGSVARVMSDQVSERIGAHLDVRARRCQEPPRWRRARATHEKARSARAKS